MIKNMVMKVRVLEKIKVERKKDKLREISIFANIVLMADSSVVKQCWREQCNKMFYEMWVQLWYCTFIEH